MAGEFFASLSAFKSMLDIAKGLKDLNDAAARNAAVIELQEKILAAQAAQAELIERVRELEEQVAKFETWDREKERYQLHDFGGGTFAYVLKNEKSDGEPSHYICAKCYQSGSKSILQFRLRSGVGREVYDCPQCKSAFHLGDVQQPGDDEPMSWADRR